MGANIGEELRKVRCPLCDSWESKRLTAFETHLSEAHGTTTEAVWCSVNGGPGRCACGCGSATKWNGWWKGYSKVVKGHNGSIYAVHGAEEAQKISEARSRSLTGRKGWSSGLTAETDDRVKKRAEATSKGRKAAFEEGQLTTWNKGLTTETDNRVAAMAETLRQAHAKGEVVPWAKGKTKTEDPRLAAMANKVSLVLRQEGVRKRLDAMKRLPQDEVRHRVERKGSLRVIGGLDGYVNDAHKVIEVECTGCGEVFTGSLRSLQYGRCFKCSPGGSMAQEEVAVWLEGLGLRVVRNDRGRLGNGMELDIFIPDMNVAIEYNGLYWHSHVNKSPGYHNNKSKIAAGTGVKLIHVFEDEWRDKRNVVESVISSKLGLSTGRTGARKCKIKELSHSERREFFDKNHMDGDTAATVSWGLTNKDDELIYAVSLRRPLHKDDGTVEVARCCPKLGGNIQGGLSRLISRCRRWAGENGYSKLMTYVDTRLGGNGKGYVEAGFKECGRTPARFWWTDFDRRWNRFKYRADKSRGMSEAEVAEEAGVVKIWGCENVVYESIV